MNKHLTITYRLWFCLFLSIFFNTVSYCQSNGTSLRGDITVEHIIEFPKEGFRNEPIRLVKDEVTGNLLYNEYGGTIWEIDITSPTPSFNFRYSAFDHNLPIVQGMTMHDDVLYLVGNEEVNNGADNVGIIAKGIRIDNNRREWIVIARTEPYLGKPETPFDHKMAGNAVSPDGQFIYVSTNSRTNHGEVAGLGREDDLNILILKIPTNPSSPIDLRNDKAWLRNNGYLYAEGIRNGFDMAFDNNGNLFEVENSGQRDDPEEMNWIREGRHYGFPYRLGGNDNPIITAGYNSNNDPLVPDDQKGTPLFAYDPNFPAPPTGVTFNEPIRNLGPDADLFRDPNTGAIRDASNEGSFITTFTAHRSPVGFGFDNANVMGGNFTGDAFMASFSGNTWPLIGGDSEDLLHIELNYNGTLDNYDANVYKIATGFAQPIDIVVDKNIIWLAEYGDGVNRGLWKITMPCGNESVCGTITPPPTPSCDAIMVTGGQQQIQVSGLPVSRVEVEIYNPNNELIFSCNDSCPNIPILNGLAVGNYQVNVRVFDENLDLVCEKNNIPAVVTSIPLPPSGDCEGLEIVGGNKQITITGLSAPIEIVQIFDQNYVPIFRCEGNDCGNDQTITDLASGNYIVSVQLYTANWELICAKDNTMVTVSGEITPPPPSSEGCDNLEIVGGNKQIMIAGLTAPIEIVQVFDANYTPIFRCEGGDCGNEQILTDLSEGTYIIGVQFYTANWEFICEQTDIRVSVPDNGNPPPPPPTGSADCNALTFTPEAGQITVTGLNTPYSQVQIIGQNTDWQIITICQGDCAETQVIPNLATGEYTVKVQLNASDGTDCYREEKMVVSNNDSNELACDLEILNIVNPDTVIPGEIITIKATIRNNNNNAFSIPTSLILAQVVTFSDVLPSFEKIRGVQIPSIPPNQEREVEIIYETTGQLANDIFFPMFARGLNAFFLKFPSEIEACQPSMNTNFPKVDFFVKYPKVDLALSLDTDNLCVDALGILQANLKITNVGTVATTNPIFVQYIDCSVANTASPDVDCRAFIGYAYSITKALAPGESAIISRPFKTIGSNGNTVRIAAWIVPELSKISNSSQSFEAFNGAGVINNPPICSENNATSNCNALNFTSSAGQISIAGLNTAYSQVQIIGQNTDWQVLTICQGDCGETQMIPNLAAGEYTVKVQLNASDGTDCYREEKVMVGDTPPPPPPPTNGNCEDLKVFVANSELLIQGLTAPVEIVQVFDQNYQLVFRCQGIDCGSEQTINDLAAGNYFVNVQFYTADWKFICAEENMVVEVGSGNGGGGGSCEESTKTGFSLLGKMDNKSFYLSENRLPFNDAKQACIDAGGQLATSLTTATIDFLKNNITGEAFLDLNDANNEGNFQWADGSTYNATIFDNNATNDYAFVANWATDLVATSEGAWKNFVCEVPCLVFGESRATSKVIEKAIKLFPNPAQSEITLQVLPLQAKKGSIAIYNIYGQEIKQFKDLNFDQAHLQLDVSNFENGLYLLKIKADNYRLISKRFIIEHWK